MSHTTSESSDFDYIADSKILPRIEAALAEILETRPADACGAVIEALRRRYENGADGARSTGGSGSGAAAAGAGGLVGDAALREENRRLQERLEDAKAQLRSAADDIAALRAGSRLGDAPFDPSNPIISLCLDTDSYKLSHWMQYPPGTTSMFSYFESRGGVFPHSVFFGLQYYLLRYLARPITLRDIAEAEPFASRHGLPFNTSGWRSIVDRHGGRLPVRVRAVPEGSVVPVRNILLSVESTDPECFWLVSWLETLLVRLWCPTTIATNSFELRRVIAAYHRETSDGDPIASSALSMHDFGARGVSSQETAMIAGAAHLTSFHGSDTIAGVWAANKYYASEMAACSIPASEHSTMTMWGRDREVDAYRNMISSYGKSPTFACVSDSYDVFNAIENLWGGALHDDVLAMPANLVIRPDSGDPVTVTLKCAGIVEAKFGAVTNSKRYRELQKVRLIQGDGVDAKIVADILSAYKAHGFAATNIAFGSGGGLLQKFHRDTMKFAFKCSQAVVDGKTVEVFKDPVTDPGKLSKKGRLDLVLRDGQYTTVTIPDGKISVPGSVMETVFENGVVLKSYTFDEIRARVLSEMRKLPDLPAP